MKTNHMISPERLAIHQVAWMRLLESLDVAPADAYPLFDRLVAAYQEPHRHYHNLEHITEMLKIVGKLADSATPLPALQLAVWFHDAVYDPHAKDNEEQSAVLALRELQPLGIPTTTLDRIAALIRATAHVGAADVDTATAFLLDADLAILGA